MTQLRLACTAGPGKCLVPSSYNRRVSRFTALFFLCFAFMAACRRDDRSKEKVEQAILDRLQNHSGLDLKTLDVATTAVSFDKNLAYATVSFHPKGDTSLASEMVMKY